MKKNKQKVLQRKRENGATESKNSYHAERLMKKFEICVKQNTLSNEKLEAQKEG